MAVELLDEDSVVSLKDIVEEEEELQDTANAVLGDSDDTNCTYLKGYVSRQAVFACGTCSSPSLPAGICLACSLRCHEGHELYELYTKRHFRCDCGNSKLQTNPCLLYPNKDSENTDNSYNHNYQGLYCTCNRPYPDNDDEIEDEMLQCIVCEDWYHSRHLGSFPPDSYEEMICDQCMTRLPFLRYYQIHLTSNETDNGEVNVLSSETETCTSEAETSSTKTETCSSKTETNSTETESYTDKIETHTNETETDSTETETHTARSSSADEADTSSHNESEDHQLKETTCLLEKRKKFTVPSSGPGYFSNCWREELCTCSSCSERYRQLHVEYLCDTLDSVKAYEERAQKTEYIHEAGMEALGSTMGHVQQVEMINGYNHMKEELKKFLEGFANSGKVVRPRDINDFFGDLEHSHKRQRLEYGIGVPPDNCQ